MRAYHLFPPLATYITHTPRAHTPAVRSFLPLLALLLLTAAGVAAPSLEVILPGGERKVFSAEDLAALRAKSRSHCQIGTTNPRTCFEIPGPAAFELLPHEMRPRHGDKTKRELLRMALLASGADDYSVAVSMAEVDSTVADGKLIVAVQRDHATLPPEEGPFRLAVEKDHRPARWVKNLTRLTITALGASP